MYASDYLINKHENKQTKPKKKKKKRIETTIKKFLVNFIEGNSTWITDQRLILNYVV